MRKLRLLVTDVCDRDCEGCCNKFWDLDALEQEDDYSQYDEILLTGGEPMLNPDRLIDIVERIDDENAYCAIYIYTAKVDDVAGVMGVLDWVDGMTVTLHEQNDVANFLALNHTLEYSGKLSIAQKSLNLYIFPGVEIDTDFLGLWKVKHKTWKTEKWLSDGEVFKRI